MAANVGETGLDRLNAQPLASPAANRASRNVSEYADWVASDARDRLNAVSTRPAGVPKLPLDLLRAPPTQQQHHHHQHQQQHHHHQQQQQQQQQLSQREYEYATAHSLASTARVDFDTAATSHAACTSSTQIGDFESAVRAEAARRLGETPTFEAGQSTAAALAVRAAVDGNAGYKGYLDASLREIDTMLSSLNVGDRAQTGNSTARAALSSSHLSSSTWTSTPHANVNVARHHHHHASSQGREYSHAELRAGPLDATVASVAARSLAPVYAPTAQTLAAPVPTDTYNDVELAAAMSSSRSMPGSSRGAVVDAMAATANMNAAAAELYGVKPGTAGTRIGRGYPTGSGGGRGAQTARPATARSCSKKAKATSKRWLSPEEKKLKKFLLNLQRLRAMEAKAYQEEVAARELERLKLAILLQRAEEGTRLKRQEVENETRRQADERERELREEGARMHTQIEAERKSG
jgi:hypothetical protein